MWTLIRESGHVKSEITNTGRLMVVTRNEKDLLIGGRAYFFDTNTKSHTFIHCIIGMKYLSLRLCLTLN